MTQTSEKRNTIIRRLCLAVLILACVTAASAAARAWLVYDRKVAAVAEIDAPMSLWIRAGNAEDAMYLDMSNINVAGTQKYKDFVFAIAGEYVSAFKLQLAYTTNNQFHYDVYRAEVSSESDYDVEYYSKRSDEYHYYKIGDPVSMVTRNGLNGS
ncbi:MAG: hypothetical protein ILP09_00815, partial [Oscillospiraceae bacterium]|nr:hypothetical protein [Oscillospiraceae bacterium]